MDELNLRMLGWACMVTTMQLNTVTVHKLLCLRQLNIIIEILGQGLEQDSN